MKNLLFILFLGLTLTSCFPEEEAITPTGEAERSEIAMGASYKNQVFYSLTEGRVTASNQYSDYDLLFSCTAPGEVMLNGAQFMRFAPSGETSFENVNRNLEPNRWHYNYPALGSTLAAMLLENATETDSALIYSNEIYLVDLGLDASGNELGRMLVRFNYASDCCVSFSYTREGSLEVQDARVELNPSKTHVGYSMQNNESVDFEPAKDQWELLFTQYTHPFFVEGDSLAYLVRGVLINPEQCTAMVDSVSDYETIDANAANAYSFTDQTDIIGYDWKEVAITGVSAVYSIDERKFYLVKTVNGAMFKMRFVDFFNDLGERGYPEFEFIRLS